MWIGVLLLVEMSACFTVHSISIIQSAAMSAMCAAAWKGVRLMCEDRCAKLHNHNQIHWNFKTIKKKKQQQKPNTRLKKNPYGQRQPIMFFMV